MGIDENKPLRVFISYTHDSQEHKDKVLELSGRLRDDGIDCHIDQYEMSPSEGWPRWMVNQIEEADFVLVVCSELYEKRFRGKDERYTGLGGKWEGAVITQDLYDREANNDKFIPVLLSPSDSVYRPIVLRSATYYCVDTDYGYEDLYRRLTNQPHVVKPQLGKLRSMPPRARKQNFSPQSAKQTPTTVESPEESADDLDSLVLLLMPDGEALLIASQRIESSKNTKLLLVPSNSKETAALARLRGSSRQAMAVAYGTTALRARIDSISQIREGGKEVWALELLPEQEGYGHRVVEMAISGYSADEIAELRARRILLNETLKQAGVPQLNRLDRGLIEGFVQGDLKMTQSPLLDLYEQLKDNIPLFVAAARLFAVLYLHLSGTIEHILNLDLRMKNGAELSVKFEGQRARAYSNVPPHIIKVRGVCKLVEEEDDFD